jgi:hypothetical protein
LNIADFLSDYEAMCETALARESGHLKKPRIENIVQLALF